MKSQNKVESAGVSETTNGAAHSESRRKLLRGTLIGAPVLLALKSTPVLACNCKLPSGFSTSGNLSRNGGVGAACTDPAKGPTWWTSQVQRNQKFSGTNLSKDTPFNSVFGGGDGRSFIKVLNSGVNLSSLVVAAYLDVSASRFVPGVKADDIKKMWNGSYRPRFATNPRSVLENENYLRYAMGLPLVHT